MIWRLVSSAIFLMFAHTYIVNIVFNSWCLCRGIFILFIYFLNWSISALIAGVFLNHLFILAREGGRVV